MAGLALFISLGGTSYAVATLPKNSVGSAQVKNGSLTANDLAKGVLTAGPQGPSGARGPRGAEGASGAGQPVALVSALPVSPADGETVYFQSAPMATAGVVWHLRYRSTATGPYKWEFVGGSDLEATSGNTGTSATTYLTGNIGPVIPLPLAGQYDAEFSSRMYHATNSAPGAAYAAVGDGQGEFPNARIDLYQGLQGSITTLVATTVTGHVRLTRGTPGIIDLRLYSEGGDVDADFRDLRVRPVRVG